MLGPGLSRGDPDLLCPGPEIIMLEPRLCRGPYFFMSGPQDNHMGTLTCYVRAEMIMFKPRFIMLGSLLIMSGPRVLCDIASIR